MIQLAVPINALNKMSSLDMLYVVIIFSLITLGFSFLIFKILPKKFFNITPVKGIVVFVFFLWALLPQIRQILLIDNVLTGVNLLIGLFVGIIASFMFVSAIVFLYAKLKNKELTKNKKELIASILIILLFNGFALNFLLFFLKVSANILVFSKSYYECGLIITGFPEISPVRDAGVKLNETLVSIDDKSINNLDDLKQTLQIYKPSNDVTIKTDRQSYNVTLVPSPQNNSLAFLGIIPDIKYCKR
jgi:hypothetical protein